MWLFTLSCQSKSRLDGKTVVITGANTGIGKETARDLYRRGARVIIACRDLAKANAALEEVKSKPPSKSNREQFKGNPGEISICKLDLSSLASVRECAKNLIENEPQIHILINNAGVMMCPYEKTKDGYELQFQTNHLGHFLFTLLLLPVIKNSGPGCRIVNVSSDAHWAFFGKMNWDDLNWEKSYNPTKAYAQSKLANVLFTKGLARRLKENNIDNITVYSLHPGMIKTELVRHVDRVFFRGAQILYLRILGLFLKTPEQGAQTTIYCAVSKTAGRETGLYYRNCGRAVPSRRARKEKHIERLWEESVKLVKLTSEEDPFQHEKGSVR